MPWWFKYQPGGSESLPVASGPHASQELAEANQAAWLESPAGDLSNPGEVVEADLDYPNTLRHPVGFVVHETQWHTQYSDDTLEPVS